MSALKRGRQEGEASASRQSAQPPEVSLSVSPLTHDIQDVGVSKAPVLILHHAGIVAFVGRHDRLHNQGPHMVSDLKGTSVEI